MVKKSIILSGLLLLMNGFNLNAQSWVKKNDFPGTARGGGVAFSIGNFGYMGLGTSETKDFWKYNPTTDTWVKIADFPGEARLGAVAVVINGKAYVGLGGVEDNSEFSASKYYDDFYEYDPSTDKWTKKASLTGDGIMGAAYFGYDDNGGNLYVLMGAHKVSSSTSCHVYSVANNTWTMVNNNVKSPDSYPLFGASSFKWNGKGYLSGGRNQSIIYTSLYEFDPSKLATNPWTLMETNSNYDMGWRGTSFGIGTKAYHCYGRFKANVVQFDAATKKLTNIGDPLKITEFSSFSTLDRPMSFVINNQGFVFGGINGFTSSPSVWAFGTPSIAVKDTKMEGSIQFNSENKQLKITSESNIVALKVFDLSGRLFHTFDNINQLQSGTIDCSFLEHGVYIVQLIDERQKMLSQKIVVQ